jgi:riboflavin synthase
MFTGLVEDVGVIAAVVPRGSGVAISVRTSIPLADVAVGDSIALDGVCLTAETLQGDVFTATAGRETLTRTTLGALRPGSRVHLERALRLGGRLGGHIVQGHVDGVGRVRSNTRQRESWVMWVEVPRELSRYVAAKGSVCLDGVSLTVNELDGDALRVGVIPHTAEVTKFAARVPGDAINVEVDILAKYVERLLAPTSGPGVSLDLLKRNGFL